MSIVAKFPPRSGSIGLAPKNCASCPLIGPCGGHQLDIIRVIGCANFANDELPADRNDMNPLDEDRYWQLWDDVGGLHDFSISGIAAVNSRDLPSYIPLLQHRYSRVETLQSEVVALHLYQILRKDRKGRYASRFADGAQLRAFYRLRPDAKVILSGVAIDRRIERFWAEHRKHGIATQLARLNLSGVTTPNFSFFTDVTRFQILRNRKRLMLVNERLSEAGVPVAPHLNAITDRDWEFWEEMLQDHQNVSVVTLEFQTGYAASADGTDAILRVADLQQKLGRLIHPILVGGAKHYLEAQKYFTRFTVIDSRPFMEAQNRRTLTATETGGFRWRKTPTAIGKPVDELLRVNLALYLEKLKAPIPEKEEVEFDTGQMDLFDSTPYFTAQPVA